MKSFNLCHTDSISESLFSALQWKVCQTICIHEAVDSFEVNTTTVSCLPILKAL